MQSVNHPFAPVAKAFAGDRKVAGAKMFGSPGLKVQGKVFAMLVRGKLVVKLSKDRVDALVAAGDGEYFDPGHGRLMKEWVAIGEPGAAWPRLAREACRFVGGKK